MPCLQLEFCHIRLEFPRLQNLLPGWGLVARTGTLLLIRGYSSLYPS